MLGMDLFKAIVDLFSPHHEYESSSSRLFGQSAVIRGFCQFSCIVGVRILLIYAYAILLLDGHAPIT
jgi:hypothetical protein